MKRFALYCTCGAGWTGTVSKNGHGIVLRYWNEIHSGDGHALCDARLAFRRRAQLATYEDTFLRKKADDNTKLYHNRR